MENLNQLTRTKDDDALTGKRLNQYTDDELINALHVRGYECYNEEDGVPLDDVDEDTLVEELNSRGIYDDTDPDKFFDWVDENYKRDNFILAKDFDARKLVDFLLDIFGLGHYVTNDQLIGRLKDFINN